MPRLLVLLPLLRLLVHQDGASILSLGNAGCVMNVWVLTALSGFMTPRPSTSGPFTRAGGL
eukprot:4719512-Alexandrium_andersonii.AAC.1